MKSMKFFALIALTGLSFALAGCGLFGGIYGSGNLTTVTSDLASFTRVSVKNDCAAHVTYGAAFSISVTLDDNLVQYLRIEKNGDQLSIGLAPNHSYISTTCIADVTLPALAAVSAANASSAELAGFTTAADLTLTAANASVIILDGIGAGNVTLAVDNASDAHGTIDCANMNASFANASTGSLAGTAGPLLLDAGNSCTVDLSALPAASAIVAVRNASGARVQFSGTLSGSVTTASNLRYIGNPASVSVSHDLSSSVFQL